MVKIVVDSRQRTNPSDSTSDFTIDMGELSHEVNGATLDEALIPALYNVTTNNNILSWFDGDLFNKQAIILPGAYSAIELATAVQNALNSANVLTSHIFTYNATTYKFEWQEVGTGLAFNWNNTGITTHIAPALLGFREPFAAATVGTKQSDFSAFVPLDPYIFILIDELGSNINSANGQTGGTYMCTLTQNPNGNYNYWSASQNILQLAQICGGRKRLAKLRIKLIGANGCTLESCNADWHMVLDFCPCVKPFACKGRSQ